VDLNNYSKECDKYEKEKDGKEGGSLQVDYNYSPLNAMNESRNVDMS